MKELNRREFLAAAAGSAAAALLPFSGCSSGPAVRKEGAAQRPNIVFIFSDQQHWRACGFQDEFFDTPHLDYIAKNGIVFDRAFCTTPQCSPSRSSIMTGFYPSTTGVMGNMGAAGGEPLNQRTIGAMLQAGGYRTGYFGKWHLGMREVATAGWDDDFGVLKPVRNNAEKDCQTSRRAVKFLRESAGGAKPFALFLSYNDPHDIYYFADHKVDLLNGQIPLPSSWYRETFEDKPGVHKQFMTEDQGTGILDKNKGQWQLYRDWYRKKVAIYDNHVGEVLGELKASGLWDNTLIVVTSDHGDMDTHHRLIFKGPFMYEQMVRVPLIIRVPRRFGGISPRRICDLDVVNVDFVPTLLEFAGLEPVLCDGISLVPILTGASGQKKRDFVISQYYGKQQWVNPIRMLRTPEFKYNKYLHHAEELYDLANDPDELVNLAEKGKYAEIKKQLAGELDDWIKANNDPFYSLSRKPLLKGRGQLKSKSMVSSDKK